MRSEARCGGCEDEELPESRHTSRVLGFDSRLVDSGVAVRDPIAEADRVAHFFGQVTFDRSTVSEDIEGGSGIIGGSPSSFGYPVGCQIDAFLNRQKEIQDRCVFDPWIEGFSRGMRKNRLGLVEPGQGSFCFPLHNVNPHRQPPFPSDAGSRSHPSSWP